MRDEMTKALQCRADIRRHTERELTRGLVVFVGEAQILVTDPVDGQLVQLLQSVDEILDVGSICVFDTEIIHDESESDAASYMPK